MAFEPRIVQAASSVASAQGAGRPFEWSIPDHYNMALDTCDRWADAEPDRIALIVEDDSERPAERYTFSDVRRLSRQAAGLLAGMGLRQGDRLAILLGQRLETALSHLAAYRLGAIAVPLFVLFGEDALLHRLKDSGSRMIVTDGEGARRIESIRHALPDLEQIVCLDPSGGSPGFMERILAEPERSGDCRTRADDPALIIYTSGTTGKAKGALHAHRVLLGHLPGVEMSHGGWVHADDVFWTPADWAWIGGLLDVLMPAWHHGAAVVARRFAKFDPIAAVELMRRHDVSATFLPPTALKMMRAAGVRGRQPRLRSIASGGESLGQELTEWVHAAFGVPVNEFYGQTECNMVVSSCASVFRTAPGAMGRAVPGHDVRIVDDQGNELPVGTPGNIGIRAPDPVMFLGYWGLPAATAEKYAGGFLLTGDTGMQVADGQLQFIGRADDVITSGGYRIGPGPIENGLLSHPAVRMAAAIGVPDPERTEVVKAFVVLNDGFVGSEALTRELQAQVRHKVGGHEYPRQIAYVDGLPTTPTGKIIRKELRAKAHERRQSTPLP